METSGNFNEPADHLAIYLELLSHLHFSLGEGTVPARRIDSLRQKTTDGTVGMVTRVCCALSSV
ncbi:chaperone protein TorD [Escherichia coli]|nr:chaperone protein TorD [Escherichia coli]